MEVSMKNIGLVLEGGGMRGLYTCGVLEFFLEEKIYFDYVIGVSAGACNAASYITRQKGRNERVNIDYIKNWRYMSLRNFILNKSLFGMDFIFDDIPNKHVIFDYEAFEKSKCRFQIGATDCNTGKPVYISKENMGTKFEALRASASLPLISPIVNYRGMELLDGGISDSVPIVKSIQDGNDKNIIVLTRNKGYRKQPVKHTGLIRSKYKNYPKLVDAIVNRHEVYNKTMDFIEKLELEGRALVIRPSEPLKVGRLEKNPDKLRALMKNGYLDMKGLEQRFERFLAE
jgi:predicted patatin/cPLA2 family phospholipase